jgi:DNA-binding NarL/FixJ family response regulator
VEPSVEKVRIGIVEDDAILGSALGETLSSVDHFEVVGWAETYQEGRALLERELDVLLVDLGLPDGSGLDLITLSQEKKALRTLVLSVFGDVRHVVQAIERGADGYILKGAESIEIKAAIEIVQSGGAPISPAVAGHILARVRRSEASSQAGKATSNLTPREIEVLTHLAKGLSYKDVAAIEGLSYHTVADHVKAIYRKLAVNSRSEAVFEAVQTGLIKMREDS